MKFGLLLDSSRRTALLNSSKRIDRPTPTWRPLTRVIVRKVNVAYSPHFRPSTQAAYSDGGDGLKCGMNLSDDYSSEWPPGGCGAVNSITRIL